VAALIGAVIVMVFLNGPSLPFRIGTVLFAVVAIEKTAILVVLPAWHTDVPSIFHALRLRRHRHRHDG
jgi:hypothetical protein